LNLKYWEWEAQPFKEKMKTPSVKDLALLFFTNETHAYRFARVLEFVKEKKYARLKDFPKDLPKATWLRYLDYAVQLGLLDKSSSGVYELTNRFSNPLRNVADYYKKWRETEGASELSIAFPRARTGAYLKNGENSPEGKMPG
jgi:hypothetical protein